MDGRSLFKGGASCGRKTYCLALQDAVGESMLKALELGYNKLLSLNCCKDLTQVYKKHRQPSWQQKTLFADITHLRNQGMLIDFLFVPRYVVGHVSDLAYITTCFPVHRCISWYWFMKGVDRFKFSSSFD